MPSLAGAFQYDNAATAIACLDLLPQFKLTDEQIAHGLAQASWPARLQNLAGGPLAALAPAHTLWLDGGHNPQGGQVLGAWMAAQKQDIYVICGMMQGKDARAYLASLAPHVKKFFSVAIPGENTCHTPAALAEHARALGMEAEACESVEKALQTITSHARTPSMICICGSLYLAGAVLHMNSGAKAA